MLLHRFCAVTALCLTVSATVSVNGAESPFDGVLSWQGIGPSRGGRATAVTGVPGDDRIYYMGAAGGGVWKTTDAGANWRPVTDGSITTGSVGALAVAPSDPDVVYAGMGERDPRGNFSHGDGMYRSDDAGATWTHVGLEDSQQIGRICVHPDDAMHVYVAALGHIHGPNEQRGIFESHDGGDSWERIHHVSENTGAVMLAMSPHDPDVLFAGYWQVHRTPWSLESGGEESGIFRSRDGGASWQKLSRGLPTGITGKSGIAISPADPDLVWAIVEAEEGGVFKSTNGGNSWRRVNEDRSLRQRAWYYTHIFADPADTDVIYVLNVGMHRSTDGGATFGRIRAPHGDHHDLWINPDNPANMVNGNDGGANVSFDTGRSWTRQDGQPTAQFYHVTVDNRYPYRVYGAQQDNSTAAISSRSFEYSMRGLYSVGGGESGYIAVRPDNPDVIYAGSYGGFLTRYDHDLGVTRNITVWPENPMGDGVIGMKERFQWTFPIHISPHDPDVLYVAGHRVYKSMNEGQSWETISPDLTTNDPEKMQSSGGPITKDNTSVEYYCTIFSLAESPLEEGVLWAGSDDGLVHVTRNGGESWENITPAMKPFSLVSQIDASRHAKGRAYLAVNRYKLDDQTPYVYRTDDYGVSWARIDEGIGDGAFVRVVREDPVLEDLLYAGTETGVYVSFDRGMNWESLQLDLPVVPITDMVITGDDLVLATQGRSFQVLRGLNLLRQWADPVLEADVHLFTPAPAHHAFGGTVTIPYRFSSAPTESVTVEVIDGRGMIVDTWQHRAEGDETAPEADEDAGRVGVEAGLQVVRWNGRYPDAVEVPDAVMWGGGVRGPRAAPGTYTARLTVGEDTHEVDFIILRDPRTGATLADYRAQFELLERIRDEVTRTHTAVNLIREARGQLDVAQARLEELAEHFEGAKDVIAYGDELRAALTAVEDELIQSKSKSSQDPLNFPIKLNDKIAALGGVVGRSQGKPTAQSYAVFEDLVARLEPNLVALDAIIAESIPEYNDHVAALDLPAVWVGK